MFIICLIGGLFNYYISCFLTYFIPFHIQNYFLILISVLIQFDNIQLFKELKQKIIENENYIRIIGDNSIEIKENEINVFKLEKYLKLKRDIMRNSFYL